MSRVLRAVTVVWLLVLVGCGLCLADDKERKRLQRRIDRQAEVDRLQMVAMRDGVKLATDVYRRSPVR